MDLIIMTCPACGHSPRPCLHPSHEGRPDRCCPCYHEDDVSGRACSQPADAVGPR